MQGRSTKCKVRTGNCAASLLDATRVPEWKGAVDVPSKTELKLAVR
jgi:hypothetical protein